jgi:hypothetical protein
MSARGPFTPGPRELVQRQLGNSFGDFFDFHVAQYSTAEPVRFSSRPNGYAI